MERLLLCFVEILHYAFAYDCHNYSRLGPFYIAQKLLLSQKSTAVYEVLRKANM